MVQDFFCEEDGLKAVEIWIRDFPYVEFDKIELKSIKRRESGKKGKPLKDEILETYYEIEADIKTNNDFVLKEMRKMGLFILASNDINISPEDILAYYKGQDKVEKGFRFLKDNTFCVSQVYLKKKTYKKSHYEMDIFFVSGSYRA
jgi:transposase